MYYDKALDFFENYVKRFDLTENKYETDTYVWKYHHTKEVVDYTKKISKGLQLSEQEQDLAMIIALFHDLGRFIQLETFDLYNDCKSKFNHALESIKILEEKKWFDNNNVNDKDRKIICFAIAEHNKKKITPNDEVYTKFAHIIRDADKIANMYRFNFVDYAKEGRQHASKEAIKEILDRNVVSYQHVENSIDQILTILSWIHDLKFKESIDIIRKEKLLEPLLEKLEIFSDISSEDYKKIKEMVVNFIK